MSQLSTRDIAYAGLFTALMAVGALVSIPVDSVPFTLQALVVLLAGMYLGPRLGALSVAAYLVLGLVAPVYHGGTSGLGVLMGPTGGYLWAFVLAAIVAGIAASPSRAGLPRYVTAGLLGLIPIHVLGTAWLAVSLHSLGAAATIDLPFIWLDIAKAVLAAIAARGLVSLPLGSPAAQRDR